MDIALLCGGEHVADMGCLVGDDGNVRVGDTFVAFGAPRLERKLACRERIELEEPERISLLDTADAFHVDPGVLRVFGKRNPSLDGAALAEVRLGKGVVLGEAVQRVLEHRGGIALLDLDGVGAFLVVLDKNLAEVVRLADVGVVFGMDGFRRIGDEPAG